MLEGWKVCSFLFLKMSMMKLLCHLFKNKKRIFVVFFYLFFNFIAIILFIHLKMYFFSYASFFCACFATRSFIFSNWHIVALQYCVNFCHSAKRVSFPLRSPQSTEQSSLYCRFHPVSVWVDNVLAYILQRLDSRSRATGCLTHRTFS